MNHIFVDGSGESGTLKRQINTHCERERERAAAAVTVTANNYDDNSDAIKIIMNLLKTD